MEKLARTKEKATTRILQSQKNAIEEKTAPLDFNYFQICSRCGSEYIATCVQDLQLDQKEERQINTDIQYNSWSKQRQVNSHRKRRCNIFDDSLKVYVHSEASTSQIS